MQLPVAELLQLFVGAASLFGVWYKINQDTSKKIEDVRKDALEAVSDVKADFAAIRSTAVSRQEHDQDIEKVKQEIRSFREEVREDIRSLSTNLTSRFDLLMQRIFEIKTQTAKE